MNLLIAEKPSQNQTLHWCVT